MSGQQSVTGDAVRRAREARRLTRAQLAEQIGSSEGTIRQLEARGSDHVPTASRFVPSLLALLGLGDPPADVEEMLPFDVVERALRQADDVMLIAETSRRMARARGARHDQRNVAAFEIRGMPESDGPAGGAGTSPA